MTDANVVSIYRLDTGLFTGAQLTIVPFSHERARAHLPEGCGYLVGAYDSQSQRFDLAKLVVVDYKPPPPSDEHEWRENAERGRPRWALRRDVIERRTQREQIRQAIAQLEQRALRPQRELLFELDSAKLREAHRRLDEIESKIVQLRAQLATL